MNFFTDLASPQEGGVALQPFLKPSSPEGNDRPWLICLCTSLQLYICASINMGISAFSPLRDRSLTHATLLHDTCIHDTLLQNILHEASWHHSIELHDSLKQDPVLHESYKILLSMILLPMIL